MNLYEIGVEYQEIVNKLIESGGELTEEIAAEMEKNDEDFQQKVDNYVKIIRNFESDSEALSNEIKRLQKLKKTKDNSIQRLKENLAVSLQQREIEKHDGGIYKIFFRKSEKIVVEEVDNIPENFLSYSPKVDKAGLKNFLKEGNNNIPGVRLEINQNLQIK